jgi:[acyl-carrier-protein] S-malonyltransferase
MGRDLFAGSAAAREIFELADSTLGFGLTRLCFEGPEDALTATQNAQPALLTVSAALLAVIAERTGEGVKGRRSEETGALSPLHPFTPSHTAGHSLGEYSALVAAGALDLPTALRLVRQRGELMSEAREGGMAAIIGIDEAPLEQICREVSAEDAPVVIANYNSPGQLVISGAGAAVERACALAKERGAKRAMPLKVSAAFHSPLMRAAAEGLAPAVMQATIVDARTPVISNVTAEPLTQAAAIRLELIAQVTSPVRWIASVQRMAADGVDTFVEIGPGNVLTGLIKRIVLDVRLVNVSDLASVRALIENSGVRNQNSE